MSGLSVPTPESATGATAEIYGPDELMRIRRSLLTGDDRFSPTSSASTTSRSTSPQSREAPCVPQISNTKAFSIMNTLSSLKTIAAAALLFAVSATPVFAQAAISEPAAFQSLHPYLDVLNGGAPTPAYWLQRNPQALRAYQLRESGIGFRHPPYRSHHSGR